MIRDAFYKSIKVAILNVKILERFDKIRKRERDFFHSSTELILLNIGLLTQTVIRKFTEGTEQNLVVQSGIVRSAFRMATGNYFFI